MSPYLKLDNKEPDFYIFFVHSSLTLLVANTVIYKEKLDPKKVRFFTQGDIYKYIDKQYSQQILNITSALPNIEKALCSEDTLISINAQRLLYSTIAKFLNPNWQNIFPEFSDDGYSIKKLNSTVEFNDQSDYLGNNLTFALYLPHINTMPFSAVASLPNCTEVNYFEEGTLNYVVFYPSRNCEQEVDFFINHPQLDPKISGYRYIAYNGHYPSISINNPNIRNIAKFFRINRKALKKYKRKIRRGEFDPLNIISYNKNDVCKANQYLLELIDSNTKQTVVKSFDELATIIKDNSSTKIGKIDHIPILCLDLWFTKDPAQCLSNSDNPKDLHSFSQEYLLNNEKNNLGIFLNSLKKDLKSKNLDNLPLFVKLHPRTSSEAAKLINEQLALHNIKAIKYPGEFIELTLFSKSSGDLCLYSSYSTLSYLAYINPPHQGIMLYKDLKQQNKHFYHFNQGFIDSLERHILKKTFLDRIKEKYYKYIKYRK